MAGWMLPSIRLPTQAGTGRMVEREAPKFPPPVLGSTTTSPSAHTARRSSEGAPVKSPAVRNAGLQSEGRLKELAVENLPPPVPRKTETVATAVLATARSGTPSPL